MQQKVPSAEAALILLSMVVMLIPLNNDGKPLTLEATATSEHKVAGENPPYYTDDY